MFYVFRGLVVFIFFLVACERIQFANNSLIGTSGSLTFSVTLDMHGLVTTTRITPRVCLTLSSGHAHLKY